MRSEISALEPKFKEILYGCIESIRATKAAVYLADEGTGFELVAQYGYRGGITREVRATDPVVDTLVTKRAPFVINGLAAEPRFAEMLYRADTTRMLIAPIYSRGKLVGFIDMRDKPGDEIFSTADISEAQTVADQFLEVFALNSLFGQQPRPSEVASAPDPFFLPPQPTQRGADPGAARVSLIARRAVDDARSAISTGVLRSAARGGHDSLEEFEWRFAENLLQPDFNEYPTLASHSRRVANLARQFARMLGLDDDDVRRIRTAGLLHDVGMRLLEFPRLYRKENPTSEEMDLLREHPMVGAALVAPVFGPEIANIILAHHERPDGTGYPGGFAGDEIPLGSRIIHICEAYDAMTAADSYQTPVAPQAAIAKIRRSGGTQFDEDLANRFSEMMAGTE